MLYLHYCPVCTRIHILSGHRISCPACGNDIAELKVPYTTFTTWDSEERTRFLVRCRDSVSLSKLSTVYTPHKYRPRNGK